MAQNANIIIITGPCGVGKTTIATLLAKKLKVPLIHGDKLKEKLYPHISYINQHPKELRELKETIFRSAQQEVRKGHSVIIDYVILGREYIEQYQQEFGDRLFITVLFPPLPVVIARDEQRDCWTSGSKIIKELYEKYQALAEIIGRENYMDTENQTPEETVGRILAGMPIT